MRNPINASQHQCPDGDKVWNFLHHSPGVFGHRSVADFGRRWITVVFDVHAGKDEDRRSANLVETVNTRQVVRWVLADTILRFLNEVVALSKLGGAGRTDLGACRLLAGHHAVRAHNAFADSRIQRVPFVLGLGKRAGRHAIAAADTLPDVVDDRTLLGLMHGADGTNRRASRMLTVHAQAAHEFVVLGENDRVFMLRLHRFGCHFVVVGQLVLLGAGAFTLLCSRCTSSRHTAGPYSSKLLLIARACAVTAPFPAGQSPATTRNRLGNRTEQHWRANAGKGTGSGVVCIRTRGGCSRWGSEPGRRVPPGYGSASFPFRPPN